MNMPGSIFLEFNLPNATTWFYFSFLLAVALFFKFTRVLSVRNLDVVLIFLLVPGLLLLQQSRNRSATAEEAAAVAALVGNVAMGTASSPQTGAAAIAQFATPDPVPVTRGPTLWIGYLWLLAGSIYLLLRCLLDLVLVRRPALGPNLNSSGLAWLAVAMFVCLAAVAFRPPDQASQPPPTTLAELPAPGNDTVGQQSAQMKLAQRPFESSFLLQRAFAVLCHLAVVVGLILVGRWHFQDMTAGMAAAAFYLLLPYTGYFVGQVHHVLPMAFVVWALVFYRQPTIAGIFLGLAAGTSFFPVLIAPLWISFYWRRGAGRFTSMFALVAVACLLITGLVLWWQGSLEQVLQQTFALSDWQPWNWKAPTHEGFWMGFHWAYRTPLFVLYAALMVMTACWPYPKNLAHVLALSAALLIGLQLWYADQGGVYVLWYLPLLLLMIFRPNLSDRRPPEIETEHDWLTNLFGHVKTLLRRFFRSPDSLLRVR
jgi:hypothetical protein